MLVSNSTAMVAMMLNKARKIAISLAMNLKITVSTLRIILSSPNDIAKAGKFCEIVRLLYISQGLVVRQIKWSHLMVAP